MTKEALQRMEEMRNLIGRRSEDLTVSTSTPTRWRPTTETFQARNSLFASGGTSTPGSNGTGITDQGLLRTVDELAADADGHLSKTTASVERIESDLESLVGDLTARFSEFEKAKVELQNVKRQCELVKSLLADATAEKDIMYEAFNEELDAMYRDVNLPEDEAWVSMSKDLQSTKESRNTLSNENSNLKRQLAEAELQRDQWGDLLRSHGLIP
jgi:chromosome segregation ATPase